MRTLAHGLIIAAAAAAFAACGARSGSQGARADREQAIPAVEAVEVRNGTLPLEERLAGSVVANNQTEIHSEVGGRIVEVLASDGDAVERGTPLVRLRASEFEDRVQQAQAGLQVADARVKQAEANNTRAQAAKRRIETIVERNLGSVAELESVQADALSAEAQLLLMQAEREQATALVAERRGALAETVIRAPTAGVVGGRNAEVGQLATASTALFVVGDPDALRVTITLTQRMLGYIALGTTVNIISDASPDDPLVASISRISPFLHPVTRTTTAEIDIKDHGMRLRPGMFVTVDVLYGESREAALVPNNALYLDPRDGRQGVWLAAVNEANRPREPVAVDSPRAPLDPSGPVTVQFVPVDVIARGRQATAIGGLTAGQWVVTVGHQLLAGNDSGQAVIQPTPWEHIVRLQQMQTRDLLDLVQRKQDGLAEGADALN
jgi:RND family efflux transporter MFP subunit